MDGRFPFFRMRFKRVIKTLTVLTSIAVILYILNSELPSRSLDMWAENSFYPRSSQNLYLNGKKITEMDQKDARLIEYAREYVTPPSELPYRLEYGPPRPSQFESFVIKFFKNKTEGVFIEAGANVGEGQGDSQSHTLYLESALSWTGLLVECNPTIVPLLNNRQRKAWVAGTCISPTSTAGLLNFSHPAGPVGFTYYGTFKRIWEKGVVYELQTFPLYTILAAVNTQEADYFRFDIEGSELDVLEHFPFELITIKVLVIEIVWYNQEQVKRLRQLLYDKGYHFVKQYNASDVIYVHESVKHMIPAES